MSEELIPSSPGRAVRIHARRFPTLEGRTPAPAPVGVNWAHDSIIFSACNEDSGSELRAFEDLSGKNVLCITAGGGRVLNLLVARPKLIWAVDLNPAQNHLLEFKVAGVRALDHDAYLRLLGVRDCRERLTTYQQQIRVQLSPAAQRFFDAHPAIIEGGILFQGRLERYLLKLSKVMQVMAPLGLRRLFECDDLEQQRRWLDKVDTRLFRAVAETCCRRGMLRAFSGDPGFYRYVPREIPLHRVIYRGVIEHFRHHLARDNSLMQLVFFGRFIYEPALPAYLNADTYDRVRDALAQVRLVQITATLNHALAQAGPEAFDALSLSDVSSYLDDQAHDRLFTEALVSSRPGAVLCSRSNIHHRPLRAEHEARLMRDRALERELAIADHSCVHKFVIGRVR